MRDSSILQEVKDRSAHHAMVGASDAIGLVYVSTDESFDIPYPEVEAIQRRALKERFRELAPKIEPLKRLADRQRIVELDSLDAAAPLLFDHSLYKSYPLALLEQNRFDRLTEWLNRLTSHDLSGIDVSKCETIDGWLDTIEAHSALVCSHSGGTTGKLSFVPRSRVEMPQLVKSQLKWFNGYRGEYGTDLEREPEKLPMFIPGYKKGRYILQQVLDVAVPLIAGSDDQYYAAYPGAMSADMQSLAGRLAAAETKGELGQLQLNPALKARREEFVRFRERQPEYMRAYFDNMVDNFKGRRVFIGGPWTIHLDTAIAGEQRGVSGLFAPNSVMITGGGQKGRVFPPDWYERICRFYGVPEIRAGYGMTEMIGYMQECRSHRYHPWPHTVPYLLSPHDGTVLPRVGRKTGRFAFMDLVAETYWGGLITGDEVTMVWDDPCECGRQGPWIDPPIRRFGEIRGSDDKISCAGTQDAHDKALEYMKSV